MPQHWVTACRELLCSASAAARVLLLARVVLYWAITPLAARASG